MIEYDLLIYYEVEMTVVDKIASNADQSFGYMP